MVLCDGVNSIDCDFLAFKYSELSELELGLGKRLDFLKVKGGFLLCDNGRVGA